ncbi:hypothetical protein KYY02_32295 [Streptomyces pimonensis]|uniref:Uncharacterized protein n=1 Tax=Streptomyces pimonensis TaxID=2860288 RepID=A0ABV4JAH6_9ACTN
MGRKSPYPEEFRKDAVALYQAAGGKRTYAASYNSGGTPASLGGMNEVDTGNDCVQTYASRIATGDGRRATGDGRREAVRRYS